MDDCRNMTESNAPVTIIQLLHMSYEFKTTDPRDKLFALFGLASDMKDITSRTDFQIDYDKSTSEIYRLFCITHMKFYRSSYILYFVGPSRQRLTDSSWPSFVPEWPAWNEGTDSHFFFIDKKSTGYRASRESAVLLERLLESPHILRIGASVSDSIIWISPMFGLQDVAFNLKDFKPGLLTDVWSQVDRHFHLDVSRSKLVDSFWRTLIANVDGLQVSRADEAFYGHFLDWWHSMRLTEYALKANLTDTSSIFHFMCTEKFAAAQRAIKHCLNGRGMRCTCEERSGVKEESNCSYCTQLQDPGDFFGMEFHSIRRDVTHDLEESDIFIKEYFNRIRNNTDVYELESMLKGNGSDTYMGSFEGACRNRVFVITEKGYLGLAPMETKQSDKIAILSGGSMPFVIREIGENQETAGLRSEHAPGKVIPQYTLLGPSYIHGLMNGEGLESRKKDKYGKYLWDFIDLV